MIIKIPKLRKYETSSLLPFMVLLGYRFRLGSKIDRNKN